MAQNGYVPTSELTSVGNDIDGVPAFLANGAAHDWFAMRAACILETGVSLSISEGGGAYRSYAQQEYYYDQYINHGGANAAYPGTSNHGWGKAVDIWNWRKAYGWLLENCHRWGFENNYAPEGWHYQHLSDASIAGLPIGEEDMPLSEDDLYKIWTYQIGNQGGKTVNGKAPVFGRAADWLTNMSDAVARVERAVAALSSDEFTDHQRAILLRALTAALSE